MAVIHTCRSAGDMLPRHSRLLLDLYRCGVREPLTAAAPGTYRWHDTSMYVVCSPEQEGNLTDLLSVLAAQKLPRLCEVVLKQIMAAERHLPAFHADQRLALAAMASDFRSADRTLREVRQVVDLNDARRLYTAHAALDRVRRQLDTVGLPEWVATPATAQVDALTAQLRGHELALLDLQTVVAAYGARPHMLRYQGRALVNRSSLQAACLQPLNRAGEDIRHQVTRAAAIARTPSGRRPDQLVFVAEADVRATTGNHHPLAWMLLVLEPLAQIHGDATPLGAYRVPKWVWDAVETSEPGAAACAVPVPNELDDLTSRGVIHDALRAWDAAGAGHNPTPLSAFLAAAR